MRGTGTVEGGVLVEIQTGDEERKGGRTVRGNVTWVEWCFRHVVTIV